MKKRKQKKPTNPEWRGRVEEARQERKLKHADANRRYNEHAAFRNRNARNRARNKMALISRRRNRGM